MVRRNDDDSTGRGGGSVAPPLSVPDAERRSVRRAGRPRIQESADDIVASVLATAGPRVGSRDYSTRRIAMMTGLSQPVVSRSVARIRGAGASDAALSNGGSLQIIGFRVEYPYLEITFEQVDEEAGNSRPQSHSHKRRGAAVMAALRVSGVAQWPQRSGEFQMEGDDLPSDRLRAVWEPGGQSWESFLRQTAVALSSCIPEADSIPGDLLAVLARHAGRGLHGVEWSRGRPAAAGVEADSAGNFAAAENSSDFESNSIAVAEFPAPLHGHGRVSQWLPSNELSVTEQIAIALRKEMMNRGFRPGDRITSSSLAPSMGLGVSTVRAGMRRMADDGLLAYSNGSFTIPLITGNDVMDLYAARLQVGSVLLRGCSMQPRHRLLAPRIALQTLDAAARERSAGDVDQADLRFQQELADSSGLTQSARSFHALTLRLRTFISILQLDYAPAVERILSDDRKIFAAVVAGEGEQAVRVWRAKVDNAVRHMGTRSPTTFHRELWDRLIGV